MEKPTFLQWWLNGEKLKERVDKNFPCGLQLGSRIELSTDYLIAGGSEELFIEQPPCDVGTVAQLAVADFGGVVSFFATIKPNSCRGDNNILLVETQNGEPFLDSVKVFMPGPKYFPKSADDTDFWEEWLGNEGKIRGRYLILTDGETDEEISFERYGDLEQEFVEPFEFKETIYSDCYEEGKRSGVVYQQMFARLILDKISGQKLTTEFLLVRAGQDTGCVEFFHGIPAVATK